MRIVSQGGGRGPFWRFLMGLVLVVVALMIVGVFAARTEGVRRLCQSWLTGRVGMDVTVGSTRIGWPYDLVLENVETADFAQGTHGFKASEIRLGPGWRSGLKLKVAKGQLRLARGVGDQWSPAVFEGVGGLPEKRIDEVSRLVVPFRRWLAVSLKDCTIQWTDADNRVLTLVTGLEFDCSPVSLPGRRAFFHRLAVDEFQVVGGATCVKVERVWLALEGQDYIEIERADSDDAVPDFWEYGE